MPLKLIPESSPLYTYTTETTAGYDQRKRGLVYASQDVEVAYRKYVRREPVKGTPLNLLFNHGNGMNKAAWHRMIDSLFHTVPQLQCAVATDLINHGDLVEANQDKLGYDYWWLDSAHDCNLVAKAQPEFSAGVNVVVGHLMGGCIALMQCEFEPQLWQACIVVNPTAYIDDEFEDLMAVAIPMWERRPYFKTSYDTKGKDWWQTAWDFYRKKSFFRLFPDEELNNVLYDEFNGRYQLGESYDEVRPKATAKIQSQIYWQFPRCAREAMAGYKNIKTPVYIIWGDRDTTPEDRLLELRKMLPLLVEVVEVPDGKHLMVQEIPEVVGGHLLLAITKAYKGANTTSKL